MATNTNSRLLELTGSDYEIADGQPDIRGWDVKNAQDEPIGKVDELIFDRQSLKVRYIVVDLDGDKLGTGDRDVLVPIGLAELHDKGDDVVLPAATAAVLSSLPEYREGEITEENENTIRNAFSGAGLATGVALAGTQGDDFYAHDHFNEDNLYQRRRQEEGTQTAAIPIIEEQLQVGKKVVETGGVRLRSRIVETPVQEDVQLREEHVTVERESVNRPATAADFKEGTIEVTEQAEVPVVSKEAYIKEEVKLNKEVTEHDHTIKETLRSTEVDVDKIDKDDVQTGRNS